MPQSVHLLNPCSGMQRVGVGLAMLLAGQVMSHPRLLQYVAVLQEGVAYRQSWRKTSCKSLLSRETLPTSAAGRLAIASAAACCTSCWFKVGFMRRAKAPAN